MLDVSVSYNRYKFLGHEFLTWLWFAMENDRASLKRQGIAEGALDVGNRLVMENRRGGRSESVTIKGDDAGLEEGMLALRKGALVTELNLCYRLGESEWRFTIKAESLHITGLKCPAAGTMESQDDLEGAVLEKVYLCEKAFEVVDALFREFIKERVSDRWDRKIVPRMKQWINKK